MAKTKRKKSTSKKKTTTRRRRTRRSTGLNGAPSSPAKKQFARGIAEVAQALGVRNCSLAAAKISTAQGLEQKFANSRPDASAQVALHTNMLKVQKLYRHMCGR